jgi:hypothetical protein
MPIERDEFDAMSSAMPELERLERYRRRAWSREMRAMKSSQHAFLLRAPAWRGLK